MNKPYKSDLPVRLVLSHGLESDAYGKKLRWLAAVAESRGICAESINYYTEETEDAPSSLIRDPLQRRDVLEARLAKIVEEQPQVQLVLAGSSLGGWVSCTVACERPVGGLLLLAPALGLASYPFQPATPLAKEIVVVHGFEDDIIPFSNSVEFASKNNATLIALPDGHRLQNDFCALASALDLLLDKLNLPSRGVLQRGRDLVKRIDRILYWLDPARTGCVENSGMEDEYMALAGATARKILSDAHASEEALHQVFREAFADPADLESSKPYTRELALAAFLIDSMGSSKPFRAGSISKESLSVASKIAARWQVRPPRDGARIPLVLEAIRKVWQKQPDLRLGQLLMNTLVTAGPCPELFYTEDDTLVKLLENEKERGEGR